MYSDSQLLKDYLAGQPIYDELVTLIADGAYGSEINVSEAKEHHIKLITTNFTGRKPADIFAEYIFNESGTELLECINHKNPFYTHYDEHNDRCNAHFRNGVESILSLLRRKYKLDKIPPHGKKETRFHFGFKIAAINFQDTSKIIIF